MRDSTFTVAVRYGQLSENDRLALMLALEDLRSYWQRYFHRQNFHICSEGENVKADLQIMLGSATTFRDIDILEKTGQIQKILLEPESFALDIITTDGQRLAVLRAMDKLGLQYAVYGFAEHFLGMRFVHPLFDMGPLWPPIPKELHIEEKPSMPLRILYETSHAAGGIRGTTAQVAHFSDIGAWRWEDWAGNHERMRYFIDWAIKNHANVVMYDDTFLDPNLKTVSEDIWEYMDLRGLKTILDINPGSGHHGMLNISKENYCEPTGLIGKTYPPTLCIDKEGFWKVLEKKMEIANTHIHRLAGLISYWDEGPNGWGAMEGAGDGTYRTLTGYLTDNCTTRFVKPILFSGDCITCGDKSNVNKWVRVLDYLTKLEDNTTWKLPPVGIGRAHCGIADPDDELIVREVVSHLPAKSISLVCCLPNCNGAERVEAWPRLIDELNATDNRGRQIILMRELNYGCKGDFPLAHISSLDRIDDDIRVFSKYKCTATCFGGVYAYHSLGWLLTWYSLRKQWNKHITWKDYLRLTLGSLLEIETSELFVTVIELLRDVQLYNGLESGEYVHYYSIWGLDLHKLAPETFSSLPCNNSPFAYCSDDEKFVRLVSPGSDDIQGIYTTNTLSSAEKRLGILQAKLDEVDKGINRLERLISGSSDLAFWEEHLIQPLRWTSSFLRSRLSLSLSYCCYVTAQELVQKGKDVSCLLIKGRDLCMEALDFQGVYIRLRPGFSIIDYPREVNPETLRCFLKEWQNFIHHPEKCCDMNICVFLDQLEKTVNEKYDK